MGKPTPSKSAAEAFKKRLATETAKAAPVTNDDLKQAWTNRFTEAKVKEWKEQFKGRELIAIHSRGKFAALRPITSDDLGEYVMAMTEAGLSKAVAQIFNNLWLDGDVELIDDEDHFMTVFIQMNNILEQQKADFFRV